MHSNIKIADQESLDHYLDALTAAIKDKSPNEVLNIMHKARALHVALFERAFEKGLTTIVNALLANMTVEDKTNALLEAAASNNLAAVTLLVESGASVINQHMDHPLSKAASNGSTEVVQFLLEKFQGTQDHDWLRQKKIALHKAAIYKQEASLKLLLQEKSITAENLPYTLDCASENALVDNNFNILAILYIGLAERQDINLYEKTDDELLLTLAGMRQIPQHIQEKITVEKARALRDAVKEELRIQREEKQEKRLALLSTWAYLWEDQKEDEVKEADETLKISQAQPAPVVSIEPQASSQPTNQEIANALPAFANYKSKPKIAAPEVKTTAESTDTNDKTSAQPKKDKSLQLG